MSETVEGNPTTPPSSRSTFLTEPKRLFLYLNESGLGVPSRIEEVTSNPHPQQQMARPQQQVRLSGGGHARLPGNVVLVPVTVPVPSTYFPQGQGHSMNNITLPVGIPNQAQFLQLPGLNYNFSSKLRNVQNNPDENPPQPTKRRAPVAPRCVRKKEKPEVASIQKSVTVMPPPPPPPPRAKPKSVEIIYLQPAPAVKEETNLEKLQKFLLQKRSPACEIILADVRKTEELFKSHNYQFEIKVNYSLSVYAGVYIFDVSVGGPHFAGLVFPPLRMQITDDYPAEIPLFLELRTITSRVSPIRVRRRFDAAVHLLRDFMKDAPNSAYRIPTLIWMWHEKLIQVFRSDRNLLTQLTRVRNRNNSLQCINTS